MKPIKRKNYCRGQAIAEYLILTALIAIASIGIIQLLSKNIRGRLAQISDAIGGHRREAKGDRATEKQTDAVDLEDFNKAVIDTGESK